MRPAIKSFATTQSWRAFTTAPPDSRSSLSPESWAEGTEAAGEVLYNPVSLDSLLQKAPRNWAQMNLEAVIETDVFEGHPGPPSILAVEAW